MKVVFFGEEFKKAVDRVLVATSKKSYLSILYCVRVEAKDNQLTVSATDSEGFATVSIDADVLEPGVNYIMDDDIKKIYNLTGNVTLESTFETNANKVTVCNGKKKSSVVITLYTDEDYLFPENPDKEVAVTTEKNLLSAMSDVAPYLSGNDTNKTMTGYSFESKKNRIVALDGHRIGIKNLPGFFTSDCSVVVPGKVYMHLKKIASAKSDSEVRVYANKKYIKFVGSDFVYFSRLIDAIYFKVDDMLNASYDCEFSINAKEMGNLAKEYKKSLKSNDKLPMLLTYNHDNNTMYSGIATSSYITSDVVEDLKVYSGMNRDLTYAFNPVFIADAMQLFNDDVMCKCIHGGVIQKSPIVFYDDTYTVLILPVNTDLNMVDRFKRFVA